MHSLATSGIDKPNSIRDFLSLSPNVSSLNLGDKLISKESISCSSSVIFVSNFGKSTIALYFKVALL